MIFASRVFIKTLYNAFPIVGVNGKVKLIPILLIIEFGLGIVSNSIVL